MPHDIDAILAATPRLAGAKDVTPLEGGITNRNYRVHVGDEAFVVRVAGENTAQLGIDRQREYACASIAADLGIGPDVVAYLPEYQSLVTRFAAGHVLSAGDVQHSDVLARAVKSLVALHAAPHFPGTFSAWKVVEEYALVAAQKRVSLRGRAQDALDEVAALERSLSHDQPAVPCHNDLLPANLIDDGSEIRIIDWEYAAMGDRYFDLGNFAENHRLSASQEEDLLRLYSGQLDTDDLQRLRTMRRVSALREAMWGFAQAGLSGLNFDFLSYADEHLDRFFQIGAN